MALEGPQSVGEEEGSEGDRPLHPPPPPPPAIPIPVDIGGVPDQLLSEVDLKIQSVYGDVVRQNDGTHLDGGIRDDAKWQTYWRKIIGLPPQRYNAPNGRVG